jgi:PPP family 3-phenylpropionic acid transporter
MAQRILPLRVFYFASFAALGAFAPFFPRWLLARGVTGLAMGMVLATLPAMGLLGPPVAGVVADALGVHGRLLRFVSLGAALSLLALALAGGIGRPSTFVVIFGLMLAHSAFRAPMVVMADVIAIDQAPRAGVSYGGVRNWGSLGALVGAVGVGYVVDPRSPAGLPVAVAAPLLVAFGASVALPDRDRPTRTPLAGEARALMASPDVPIFLAAAFAAEIALSSYDVGITLRLGELGASPTFIGGAWAVGVVSEIALMAGAGRLIERFTPSRLIVAALVTAAIRCALLGTLRSLPIIIAIQPLHALSVALFWISSVSYVKARVPVSARASAQGLFAAVMAGGTVAGVLLWGTLYRHGGSRVLFGAASAAAVLAAAIAVQWARRAHPVYEVV